MKVLARGVNFMGQLGIQNKRQSLQEFQEIPSLKNIKIKQLEAQYSQSYALLNDNQILHWGYVIDSYTTAKVLDYYMKGKTLVKLWQKYSCFGDTLGFRLGFDSPNLINKTLLENTQINKISVGACIILALDNKGNAYGLGDNYKGQLGVPKHKYCFQFSQIQFPIQENIVDVSAGLQFSYFLTNNGDFYGNGRANWRQVLSTNGKDFTEFYTSPQKQHIGTSKVVKISGGFQHVLFLTQSGEVYSLGLNNYGQCGQSSISSKAVESYTKVFIDIEPNEYITDIQAGKSHSCVLTNLGNVIAFGSNQYFQIGKQMDSRFETSPPTKVELPLQKGEKVVRIKVQVNRNAAFTNLGNCYVWGGQDHRNLEAENYSSIWNMRNELKNDQYWINDVGLGLLHTLVSVELKN